MQIVISLLVLSLSGKAAVTQPVRGGDHLQHVPGAPEGGQDPVRNLHLRRPQLRGGRGQQSDHPQCQM